MPIQYQTQHAQSLLTASTDPVTTVQGHYQPPKMKTYNAELLVQAGYAEGATKTLMTPYRHMTAAVVWRDNMFWVETRGMVAGAQGPSHFVNVTPLTATPENLMRNFDPPLEIYSGLEEAAGTGSVADTNTLGPQASGPPTLQIQPQVNVVCEFTPGAQPLATIPQYVFPHRGDIGQGQLPIPHEDPQALIAGGSVLGANRTTYPITPGAFDGIVGDSWTGTLWWQREREGPWSHVRAVATDGVRNPCVYFFVRCKLMEDSHLCRMFSKWPSLLQIQFTETVIPFLDIQAWILKTRAPVARIKGNREDSHQFDDLVKLVRSGGSVSRRSRSPTYPLTR